VLAALPLPGRAISMIWSLGADEASRVAALDAPALCRSVADAMQGALGDLRLVTPQRSYPLRRLSARRLVGRRVALVGDAAHVIHPLAGQGLNLGLQDVRALLAALGARAVRDPADALLLRAYERSRREPILAMDFVVDGLYRLFGARDGALARLRNTGLNLTDRMPVVKNVLIRRAMA
jgi:2-polyprenyl-6-methoxyphenol hydroxylase-like FAD-dependent oxidoreductase